MAPTKPTPLTWTIRFKSGKLTTFLHVEPSQSLESVKSQLLDALRQRYPSGNLNGAAIPEQVDELLLARQVDIANPEKGWTRLDEVDALEGPATKKRKTSEKDMKNRSTNTNFKSLGLIDGAVLAFKFANEEEEEDEGLGLEDENWNVELPAYDDALAAGLMNGDEQEIP